MTIQEFKIVTRTRLKSWYLGIHIFYHCKKLKAQEKIWVCEKDKNGNIEKKNSNLKLLSYNTMFRMFKNVKYLVCRLIYIRVVFKYNK